MATNRIVVKRGKEKRVVQVGMAPAGFHYVKDYEPKKKSKK